MSRKELKDKAKKSLKDNLGNAIGIFLVYYLFSSLVLTLATEIFNEENLLAELVSGLALSSIAFGLFSFYLKLSRNETVSISELFSKTNLFWSYICISFMVGLFTTLWTLLFIIPGIIAAISYSLVYYIKLDNNELTTLECINKSKEMMNGHKMDYFILQLSYLGWSILLIIILVALAYLFSTIPTIAIILFMPLAALLNAYVYTTNCNFYNYLKENNN